MAAKFAYEFYITKRSREVAIKYHRGYGVLCNSRTLHY